MVERHNDGRGEKDTPVAIKSHQGKRAKNMEMRFNTAAAQVNEQAGHDHLREGDDMTSGRCAGRIPREENRKASDQCTQEDRGTDIEPQRIELRSVMGHPTGQDDARDPLSHHQPGEQSIRAPGNTLLVLGKCIR